MLNFPRLFSTTSNILLGQADRAAPVTYALRIVFKDGQETVLPVSLHLLDGRSIPFLNSCAFHTPNSFSTTYQKLLSGIIWDVNSIRDPIREHFSGFRAFTSLIQY